MAELLVIDELRDYLIAAGAVQAQDAVPSLTVPSVWINPRDGAPQPRRNSAGVWLENAVVTLVDTNLMGPPHLEAWIEEAFIDVIVRARLGSTAKLTQRSIKKLLAPMGDMYGRKHWTMNSLLVEYSREWRGDQQVPSLQSAENTGAGHLTYDRVAGYVFGCRRKILSGLTLP